MSLRAAVARFIDGFISHAHRPREDTLPIYSLVMCSLVVAYGVANVIFAFRVAPVWLEPRLGPDRRTRALLAFLPHERQNVAGRLLYGVICAGGAGWLMALSL